MQGSKEYFLRVKEAEYFELPQALRERSVVYYNDYELYKDNPSFKALNKAYRDAKKRLRIGSLTNATTRIHPCRYAGVYFLYLSLFFPLLVLQNNHLPQS